LLRLRIFAITADTFGSELGTLDSKTYLITTFQRTTTGINGGISFLGEVAALVGSLIIAISYSLMSVNGIIVYDLIAITTAGFISCQIDSILGAVFENKGKLSKGQVNFLASLSSVLIALPFFLLIH
jgi:Predicted membrane protein